MQERSKSLDYFRSQVRKEIEQHYRTTEEFCFASDIDKALMSRILSNDNPRDFRIKTIEKIAKALKKKLIVKMN